MATEENKHVYLLKFRYADPKYGGHTTFSIHETLDGAIKAAENFMHNGYPKHYDIGLKPDETWIKENLSDYRPKFEPTCTGMLTKRLYNRKYMWKKDDQYLEIIERDLEK